MLSDLAQIEHEGDDGLSEVFWKEIAYVSRAVAPGSASLRGDRRLYF